MWKKSDCEISGKHIHKYVKQITDEISLENYFCDESVCIDGYLKSIDEYLIITKENEEYFKLLNSKGLFNSMAGCNWDYLFNKMATQKDYLEFYYQYETTETYSTTDKLGNESMQTQKVTHEGWTKDPTNPSNTGLTRLCHHRYFGYKIDDDNKLVRSEAVDDIRQLLYDYIYYNEDCTEIVSKEFMFDKNKLQSLKPEDFDIFENPVLKIPYMYGYIKNSYSK